METEEEPEEEQPSAAATAVDLADASMVEVETTSVEVFWDVDTCPLALLATGAGDTNAASIISVWQRTLLRLQTAWASGSQISKVVAFGEFGNLLESPIAQALVACGVHVVACGPRASCPRGGLSFALLSAMTLRALDIHGTRAAEGVQPLVVASARPELQLAAHELAARGCNIGLSAPPETLKKIQPRNGDLETARHNLAVFGWPKLYPITPDELENGLVVRNPGMRLKHSV